MLFSHHPKIEPKDSATSQKKRRKRRRPEAQRRLAIGKQSTAIEMLFLAIILHVALEMQVLAASSPFDFASLRPTASLDLSLKSKELQFTDLIRRQLTEDTSTTLQSSAQFDSKVHRNIREAIREHPELREFGALCELDGVKEIISLDRTPLTVFAPLDSALSELISKVRSGKGFQEAPINLSELAKHHIAQGFVAADSETKFPVQFQSYSMLSPLFLTSSNGDSANSQKPNVFVNNAKIVATHLIQIDADNFQTLHIVDAPIEFVYVNKKGAQIRPLGTGASAAAMGQKRSKKAALTLDDLVAGQGNEALLDYVERFGDFLTNKPSVDVLRTATSRAQLTAQSLNFERLVKLLNSTSSNQQLNTYFLPIDLEQMELSSAAAHIVPNQVLFTRAMGLGGSGHRSADEHISLSLAKTLPQDLLDSMDNLSPDSLQGAELSHKLAQAPLLLQSKRIGSGIASSEIVLANVPLTNGVLHLIRRPIVAQDTTLLDLINDHRGQLSKVLAAYGTQTQTGFSLPKSIKIDRFRDLLARDKQLLSTFSSAAGNENRTILIPSDEAFAKLRYDLRALVSNDESLIPRHWDAAYCQELLDRILKRHLISGRVCTSDTFGQSGSLQQQPIVSELGKQVTFRDNMQVESDATRANIVHFDLIGTNGVVHIIDRVLGEDQETVDSLLKSIVLKYSQSTAAGPTEEGSLNEMIQSNVKAALDNSQTSPNSDQQSVSQPQQQQQPELAAVRKAIGQYLDELAGSNSRQLRLLAASVNITCALVKQTSLAEGNGDDWSDKFKQVDRLFTYFVPSDLAWLRLQQSQPELYAPLMHFLAAPDATNLISSDNKEQPKSSQSSRRLRQILERHLVVNRKLTREQLNEMDSLQTLGAKLRLVEPPNINSVQTQHQLSVESSSPPSTFAALHSIVSGNKQQQPEQVLLLSNLQPTGGKVKSLRLDSSNANIVHSSEASNGFVYVIDNVLLLPEDSDYIVQTSQAPAASSPMSSLLGVNNYAIIDFIHNLIAPNQAKFSAQSMLIFIGTLSIAILILIALALTMILRKSRNDKLNRHRQLESGLASSSSASNAGSTSTTKSL